MTITSIPATLTTWKKWLLFCCFSLITASLCVQVKLWHNLKLYHYHIDSSRMDPGGAWHFPTNIPDDAKKPLYHYDFSEHTSIYQLSFHTDNASRYQDFHQSRPNGNIWCYSYTKIDDDKVTFFHERTTLPTTTSPLHSARL